MELPYLLGCLAAPAEVPPTITAFLGQQHRWNKGLIQTAIKLLPRILRSDQPSKVKVEAFFHLSANLNYPLMCVLSVLMAPSMIIRYNMGWYEMLLIDIPLFFAATASVANFYMVCQRELYPHTWTERLRYLPFLMSIGIGLAVNNTKAVLEALFDKPSDVHAHAEVPASSGRRRVDREEVSPGLLRFSRSSSWRSASTSPARSSTRWPTASTAPSPFLMLFQIGFLYTGLLWVLQQFGETTAVPQVLAE